MFACPRNRAPSLAEKPLESVKHAMPDRLDTNRPDGPALSLIGGVIAMSRAYSERYASRGPTVFLRDAHPVPGIQRRDFVGFG